MAKMPNLIRWGECAMGIDTPRPAKVKGNELIISLAIKWLVVPWHPHCPRWQ